MTRVAAGLVAAALLALSSWAAAADEPEKIPVRVVVLAMFQPGTDGDNSPGEFRDWVAGLPLDKTVPFPLGTRPLRYNADKQVLGMVTGIGTAHAASAVMALGTDPRFDLSKAYWVIAGIAGVNPREGTVGSAVWSEWVVDGDLAHEIDSREIPPDWPTGYYPLSAQQPYQEPPKDEGGSVYHLNAGLRDWAFDLTRGIAIPDTPALKAIRQPYANYPAAAKPPSVLKGDDLSAATYWGGRLLTDWAIGWVKYWTGGKGTFVTSAMEDSGTLQSLTRLAKAGRADFSRVLVLRTASDFSMQPDGMTAVQGLTAGQVSGNSAFMPALDAAYEVGSAVVNEISRHWEKYAATTPGG